jgi:hypothetical protein
MGNSVLYYIAQELKPLQITVLVKEDKFLGVGHNIETALQIGDDILQPHIGNLVLRKHLQGRLADTVILVRNTRLEYRKILIGIDITTLASPIGFCINGSIVNTLHVTDITTQLSRADSIHTLRFQLIIHQVEQFIDRIPGFTTETAIKNLIAQKDTSKSKATFDFFRKLQQPFTENSSSLQISHTI